MAVLNLCLFIYLFIYLFNYEVIHNMFRFLLGHDHGNHYSYRQCEFLLALHLYYRLTHVCNNTPKK